MIRLSVKLDHVATLRHACRGAEPDPVQAAVLAELGGAEGISVHLRGDRRHVQDRDVEALRHTVRTRLHLEIAPTQEMLHLALAVKPAQVTLVPERREEPSPMGGLDVVLNASQLRPFVRTLQEAGVAACLLVEADLEQVKQSHKLDARAVELDSAPWAEAGDARGREAALRRIADAARLARKLGMEVHAGVGDAVVGRALLVGMERAVREMAAVVRDARAERV
jgi:pyridoxine 5-phosphate synthase